MVIGIDGNEANVENKVGIGEYAFELLTQFENFKFPISNFQFQIYLKQKPRVELPRESDAWKYRVVGPRKLWTQFGLPLDLHLHSPKPDVFFTPTHYAPRIAPMPTAVSVMDVSYVYFPHLFRRSDLYQLRNWTAYSVKNAKIVFTISKSSKDDIIKEYKIAPEKIVVTYPGIRLKNQSTKMQHTKVLKEKYGIAGDYVLFVGTLQPRKNLVRLIEAFSILKNKDIVLVIVGKKGWLYEEILAAPKKFHIEERVKFLDFVKNDELPVLYQNAKAFVLPSLYEGFGLPVLESMQQGCAVITSNVSSMPEAGGDAALYVDPTDVGDIAEKIDTVVKNEKLRQELIKKGYDQVKKFSWEKTARETLSVLEDMIKK